jgi:hypothetical protein
MKVAELYGRVRYAVRVEGISRREAARCFRINPRTVAKMLTFSVPPGYRRGRPPMHPCSGVGKERLVRLRLAAMKSFFAAISSSIVSILLPVSWPVSRTVWVPSALAVQARAPRGPNFLLVALIPVLVD